DDLNLKAPTATDNCDGSIKGSHNITDFPITSEITITWTFTDEVDNTAAQTQTVTIGDTEAPEVTGTLPEVTAQCPIGALEELEKPDAPADNCKGTVTVALKTGTPFPIQAGTTTITWVYTDEAGNTSEQTQDVTIEDNTDPLPGMDLEALTVDCGEITSGDDLNLKAPTATDNCDGSIMGSHNITDFPITSEITITWTFTDEAGNTATQTQDLTIQDTTDPMLGMDLEALTVDCGEITSGDDLNMEAPTATDNCDGSIKGSHNITDFPITSEITITWTFTDEAGNTATQTQEVMITPCVLSAASDAVEAVIFPNPSGRYVEVQSPVESPIRILSVGGELVLKSTTNVKIDAASLYSGLYLVQLPDGRLLKFVKQ
ncbi:MAG: T9SS type A sorting domain-containing protein, partial [Ekhidna sp.]|nr:T9SS type A sorting domain-containing protein [Ekhidna sp.]